MENKISVQFLGAAGTVTGSKHLLRTPELNILIDCGLFQGIKTLRLKNREPFSVDVVSIDILLLTHAHLDHCGYIPLLVKQGFKGKIFMTAPTRDLVEIVLLDSARIQEEDAEHANKGGYTKHHPATPLYTQKVVRRCFEQFEICEPGSWLDLSPNIRIRYQRNGHILGSCFIEVECWKEIIVFSGDIGRNNSVLLDPPHPLPAADYLIMESTYGNRLHDLSPVKQQLADAVNETLHQHGNIIIPSFAIGRTQELMLMLTELKEENKIPDVPVILDSPMGADATSALFKHKLWHKLSEEQCQKIISNVRVIRDFRDTLKTLEDKHSKVIIAGSGMVAGGRVLEYLKHYLRDRKNLVLLSGYQAEGTRGRALKEGNHELKIHGNYYKVKAHVKELSSLSAHADQQEMLDWLKAMKGKPKLTFLVHGEPLALDAFRVKLKDELDLKVIIPEQNETHDLFSV